MTSWRPWHVDGQVAGYKKTFANGVEFLTVHGAGHEVRCVGPWIDGWMYGWRDGGMEGCMDGGMDGGMEGWMEGGMEGGREGGMDGWMDGWMGRSFVVGVNRHW